MLAETEWITVNEVKAPARVCLWYRMLNQKLDETKSIGEEISNIVMITSINSTELQLLPKKIAMYFRWLAHCGNIFEMWNEA